MKREQRKGLACLGALALLLAATTVNAAETKNIDPRVFPPDSKPYGMSYAEWHVAWWTWVMSIPMATNPSLNADTPDDTVGPPFSLWFGLYDASLAQSGRVWFLAETYGGGWTVERDAVIPAGTALCVPLQNYLVWGYPPFLEDVARYYLDISLDTAVITCEIDGVPVENLAPYRHQSPAGVPLVLGEVNMYGRPAGEYTMADDGYYLVLVPLSVGEHIIHWTASITEFSPFGPPSQGFQEVTYHLTVVP